MVSFCTAMGKLPTDITKGMIRTIIPAAKAAIGPPLGPILGQRGLKAMDYCKSFNEATKHYKPLVPLRVEIYIKADKSYTWIYRNPSTTWFLHRLTGISKFESTNRGTGKNGKISKYQLYEIAKIKQTDEGSKHLELKAVYKMVVNHAMMCGLTIV